MKLTTNTRTSFRVFATMSFIHMVLSLSCVPPPAFPNLRKSYSRLITTSSSHAQAHFSDGLLNWFGFNRFEALRSFHRASACDTHCAMCQWGLAIASGPFLNERHVNATLWAQGRSAATKATALASEFSRAERGLVSAIQARYDQGTSKRQSPQAYSDAMEELAKQVPEDLDVQVLAVEALEATQGYKLHKATGSPPQLGADDDAYKHAGKILQRLSVLQATKHPLALHLHIHLTDQLHPARRCQGDTHCAAMCLPAANALEGLVPDSGHLLHMPSHCYMRTGSYAQAAKASEASAKLNRRVVKAGFHAYDHPMHFIGAMVAGALYAGQEQKSSDGARWLQDWFGDDFPLTPYVQLFFARWEELRDAHLPEDHEVSFFARGLAFAAAADVKAVQEQRQALVKFFEASKHKQRHGSAGCMFNMTVPLMLDVLQAQEHQLHGNEALALKHLRAAADAQADWWYMEPPHPIMSIRPCLGEHLLRHGKLAEAKAEFEQDLLTWPNSGFSTLGILNVCLAAGEDCESQHTAFVEAWQDSDFQLYNSCPMVFAGQPAPREENAASETTWTEMSEDQGTIWQ